MEKKKKKKQHTNLSFFFFSFSVRKYVGMFHIFSHYKNIGEVFMVFIVSLVFLLLHLVTCDHFLNMQGHRKISSQNLEGRGYIWGTVFIRSRFISYFTSKEMSYKHMGTREFLGVPYSET